LSLKSSIQVILLLVDFFLVCFLLELLKKLSEYGQRLSVDFGVAHTSFSSGEVIWKDG
jgi:hypothetical protein